MKKLTLNVDSLRVESFAAGQALPARGTVEANELLAPTGTRCPSHHATECCATDVLLTNCC
ncbi:hypothetical protein [Longimicrobium sp.]|uniref:hypothetical protein n=1 Tax=Longimicrobium sp. TaxID=2029185 RepID=UPI002E3374E7|nr:hypothetical protein [Longimicrobium sp.]HEX6039871.1 hypothetical protein [Longimicrobium sp.]